MDSRILHMLNNLFTLLNSWKKWKWNVSSIVYERIYVYFIALFGKFVKERLTETCPQREQQSTTIHAWWPSRMESFDVSQNNLSATSSFFCRESSFSFWDRARASAEGWLRLLVFDGLIFFIVGLSSWEKEGRECDFLLPKDDSVRERPKVASLPSTNFWEWLHRLFLQLVVCSAGVERKFLVFALSSKNLVNTMVALQQLFTSKKVAKWKVNFCVISSPSQQSGQSRKKWDR